MTGSWLGVFLSIALIVAGILPLPNEGSFRGFSIPVWGLIIEIIIGLIIGFFALRSILTGESKKSGYTDKDVEKSKRHLEQMYIKEHGVPPEYPENSKKNK